MNLERSKLIAILTGLFSLLLGGLYLILVQLLDWRGEMIPAPVSLLAPWFHPWVTLASLNALWL